MRDDDGRLDDDCLGIHEIVGPHMGTQYIQTTEEDNDDDDDDDNEADYKL